jgi:hypothetical protein
VAKSGALGPEEKSRLSGLGKTVVASSWRDNLIATTCPCSKINSGQLGVDKEELAAVSISRGSTLVAMIETADLGEGNNIAGGGRVSDRKPARNPHHYHK